MALGHRFPRCGCGVDMAAHTDGTVLQPTLIFDGKMFEENGIYRDAKAREYAKRRSRLLGVC